MLIENAISGRL